jgi:spoIIIJ-associated protein
VSDLDARVDEDVVAAGQTAAEAADAEATDEESSQDDAEVGEESEEAAAAPGASPRSGPRVVTAETLRRLEEEGEVAADYLEELLDIVDVDGDIDIDVENGRAAVAIVTEQASDRALRRFVGQGGEVLDALQELTRLAVQAATGERSRLMLDVAGHRANRRRTLESEAARACQEVVRGGEAVKLAPMTAFERKIVHDVVAESGLISESDGEEPNRRVVIRPVNA